MNARAMHPVALVGAGPGDPDLLTLGAARRLAAADVVLHDSLVGDGVLALCGEHTRLIDVGKRGGGRSTSQRLICGLLVREARSGARVVRLKGGDPFIFGRGGEEAEHLVANGVPIEVVPGISSCVAAPASAMIPVTHRGVSTHVSIVTGHAAGDPASLEATWAALGRAGGTLVVLMGLSALPRLAAVLIDAGRSPDTPAAAISAATTAQQQVVTGTLGDLAQRVRDAALPAPATVVIGEVVAVRDALIATVEPALRAAL